MAEVERIACEVAKAPCMETHEDRSSVDCDAVTTLDFEAIAKGARVVCVTYRGQRYQLRSTRNGKLILNK